MAGGVGDYVNRKHSQYGGNNENDAPITQPELAQRQAAAQGLRFKAPGLGAGRRNQSMSGPSVPFRDTVTRTGTHQTSDQGQTYAQPGSLWAESSFGSDSLSTVKDKSFGHHEDNSDHELEDAHGQDLDQDVEDRDQDVGLSDQRSEIDPEEEEAEQNDGYYNVYPRQPGTNQSNIPMRGVTTNRFNPPVRQRQPPAMEAVLSDGKRAANGPGQSYKKNTSGRLGYQDQEDENQQHEVDRFAPSEVDEDTMHSIVGNGQNNPRKASSKRQREDISSLDFDREMLIVMPYERLERQPFDEDPNQPKTSVAQGSPKSLDERMELFKSKPAGERAEFLATLSIDEWEEAGEWLMKQFGSVMGRAADARRERRKIAAKFEDKLAARDAEVRKRADGVTASLKDLKNGGQDLLRGKTPT
ncbi:hypothetical protein V496_05310 [Pseudogymnoascus sp. VKM F-4515 (FW-2607)]|nr:hypothetical protein V496_05310 [Pseudogymnoascus sp. VKM F-4515 (FW-2607)]KFY97373.1 hypothetical protein V498_02100 [Pseudogymnoascus sp. VKM F-4517 (FW-2822)]